MIDGGDRDDDAVELLARLGGIAIISIGLESV